MTQARMTGWVSGRVQGVGFRWWARSRALELGLRGSASNLADGRVEVVAEGGEEACERLCLLLEVHPVDGRPGTITALSVRWSEPKGLLPGFVER